MVGFFFGDKTILVGIEYMYRHYFGPKVSGLNRSLPKP